jgi:ATP-binding cassette subfamily C protein
MGMSRVMRRVLGLPEDSAKSPVSRALDCVRAAVVSVGAFSAVVNLLMLSGSLYMLQVYDRVLTGKSVATLIALTLLLVLTLGFQGFLDSLRSKLMTRVAARVDEELAEPVFRASLKMPLLGVRPDLAAQPLRDLDQLKGFLASPGPFAVFDLPWLPFFVFCTFLLHPTIGLLVLAGALVIVGLTFFGEASSKNLGARQVRSGVKRQDFADAARRNTETLSAMGMIATFHRRFSGLNRAHMHDVIASADATSAIGAFVKTFRMFLQSAVLGLGAYLAMRGEMSAGAMIAASIIASRALAPVEVAVAHWRQFALARQSAHRLDEVLRRLPEADMRTPLPPPTQSLHVHGVAIAPPGAPMPVLSGVEIKVNAGQALCIVGASASGKSTLARAIVGLWQPQRGEVRIDGAALGHWDPQQIGSQIGYLPQDVELFEGTLGENISRFDPAATPESIHEAARAAGVYEMIMRIGGFDLRIGEGGVALSGGQRQLVGLARALYRNPFLVVLDEPNSNLDQTGDRALIHAIMGVRRRGGICVVITHRSSCFQAVDLIAILAAGAVKAFGPRDAVLRQFLSAPDEPERGDATAQPAAVTADGAAAIAARPAAAGTAV